MAILISVLTMYFTTLKSTRMFYARTEN
jgi:hypothetical protein